MKQITQLQDEAYYLGVTAGLNNEPQTLSKNVPYQRFVSSNSKDLNDNPDLGSLLRSSFYNGYHGYDKNYISIDHAIDNDGLPVNALELLALYSDQLSQVLAAGAPNVVLDIQTVLKQASDLTVQHRNYHRVEFISDFRVRSTDSIFSNSHGFAIHTPRNNHGFNFLFVCEPIQDSLSVHIFYFTNDASITRSGIIASKAPVTLTPGFLCSFTPIAGQHNEFTARSSTKPHDLYSKAFAALKFIAHG